MDPRQVQDARCDVGRLRTRGQRRGQHRGHLSPGGGYLDPDDRHAQAQGREGHHRHSPEGSQEARRIARLISMRIILFTGKGGVGKTTAAAGTAVMAARRGERTLVLSTDAAHSLADAFGVPIGSEPTEVETNLFVQQVDAQARFERSWAEIQGYLLSVLAASGVDPITAEELTVIPGAEEVLALLELRTHALSGDWDVIVVDCAPTAETLRLLALPEALGWYMDRVFPMERRVVKALRPVLARAAGVPMPHDSVFDAVERLHRDLEEVHEILTGKDSSVRLVLTPETVVVAEARRSLTTLSLFGYRVDGVIANRVFPEAGSDVWRKQWVSAQAEVLAEVCERLLDLPIWRSSYRPCAVSYTHLRAHETDSYLVCRLLLEKKKKKTKHTINRSNKLLPTNKKESNKKKM